MRKSCISQNFLLILYVRMIFLVWKLVLVWSLCPTLQYCGLKKSFLQTSHLWEESIRDWFVSINMHICYENGAVICQLDAWIIYLKKRKAFRVVYCTDCQIQCSYKKNDVMCRICIMATSMNNISSFETMIYIWKKVLGLVVLINTFMWIICHIHSSFQEELCTVCNSRVNVKASSL
jgi:hypothetical protein